MYSKSFQNLSLFFPPGCQSLIHWCLSFQPEDRPILKEILSHSWMKEEEEEEEEGRPAGGARLPSLTVPAKYQDSGLFRTLDLQIGRGPYLLSIKPGGTLSWKLFFYMRLHIY